MFHHDRKDCDGVFRRISFIRNRVSTHLLAIDLSDETVSGVVNVSQQDNRQATVGALEVSEDAESESASQLASHLGPTTEDGDVPIAGTMRAGDAGSMPNDDDSQWRIEVGSDVIGQCGHKVGEVVAVRDDVVVVEKGFFMPVDFYIPKSAIQRNNEHGLFLNVTKNEALHRGWDVDPRLAHAS
jgi:hypothetical protein